MNESLSFFATIVIALISVCFSLQLGLAQIVEVESSQLAEESQSIVRGTVKSTQSEWNEEKTYIWTFVTMTVSNTISGEDVTDKEIVIKVPGGSVGEISQRSSDEVTFKEGEDAVVFLGKETYKEKEYYNVTRLSQGKLTVENGQVRGKAVDDFIKEVREALEKKQ